MELGEVDFEKLTPMMKQYVEIKEKYMDCILMYRTGDFYEMFFDDAIVGCRDAQLALTGHECGNGQRATMCGVPFHAVETYITKLVAKGHKVAICEQMEDPKTAKGIVKREVVRIVTPGTNLNEVIVNARYTNYIAGVVRENDRDGVVFADVASGEITGTIIENDIGAKHLVNELARFSPVELALGGNCQDALIGEYVESRDGLLCFSFDSENVKKTAADVVAHQLDNAETITDDLLRTAAAAVISYIIETQKGEIPHMREFEMYTASEFVEIDVHTRRNLELTETMGDNQKKGSLYGVLDKTRTSMGSRMLKSWIVRPLMNVVAIQNRLDAVEEMAKSASLRDNLHELLATVADIERLMGRISLKIANARDLALLRSSLVELPYIKETTTLFGGVYLAYRVARIDLLEDVYKLLDSSIAEEPPISLREGGIIREGYNEDIDKLKKASKDGKEYIASLEKQEREETGIKTLKVGFNKVFGYYIDVSKGNVGKVPDRYIRKQTLVNNERYITAELKEAESAVLSAHDRLFEIEYDTFVQVRDAVAAQMQRIMETARAVAEIDAIYSLADVAVKNNYIKPTVTMGSELTIKDGRHPVVESLVKGVFVPNDTTLDCESNKGMIITGPNMAGKSTYMRQAAIITLMAQMGSFVPAKSCTVGIVDKVFTRIGASDDLTKGKSTFMVEMSEVSYILANATKRSLVVFDEVGRGTSTYDGLSIAWAVMEHMAKIIGAKTLFATHYHELAVLEDLLDGVKNYNTVCKKRGDDITFLRKIVRGQSDDSFGIEVAKLAGVPESVIKRAKKVLRDVENGEKGGENSVKKKEKEPQAQLNFDMVAENPIVKELKELDVTTLTPIEAMNLLYRLCEKARG